MNVILASASPRRKQLLGLLCQRFVCFSANIDEQVLPNEAVAQYVLRMAHQKAGICASTNDSSALVLSADTAISLDDQILGKPADYAHAQHMLRALSGRSHLVLTAVSARQGEVFRDVLVTTTVTFAILSDGLISRYLATEEPWDKAGAYAIQGMAGSFVAHLEGSYSAVVGLPLLETRDLLATFALAPDWTIPSNA